MALSFSELKPLGGSQQIEGLSPTGGAKQIATPTSAAKPRTFSLSDLEPVTPPKVEQPKQRLSLYDFRRSPQTQQLLRSRDSKKFDEAMKLLDDADVIRGKKIPQGKNAVQMLGQGVTPTPDAEPKAKELEGRASNLINEIFPDGGYGRRWINDKEAADMGLLPKYQDYTPVFTDPRVGGANRGQKAKTRINTSTKTGRWYELDPKTAEWLVAKDQRESTERAVQAEEQKRLEGSVMPKSVQSLYTGMRQGANSVAGVVLRGREAFGAEEPFTADNTVRRGQAMDAAAEKLQPGWFDRALRGTGSSGFQMATGGLAGPAGMIATFAATTANEKYTSAIDAGRTPEQAQSEAKTAALIEGGITTAFQLAGLGGLESVFQKGVTKSTVAPAIKNAIGRASKGTAEVFQAIGKALGPTGRRLAKGQIDEQLEELTVNTAQEFANRAQGYAPQDLPEIWLDTIVGTAINMGIMQGTAEVSRKISGTSDNQLLNDPEQARVWAATQPELAREIADAYAAGKPITRQMMNKAGLPRGDQEQRQAFGFAVTRAMANLAKGDQMIAEMNSGPSTQGPQPEKPEKPAAPQQQTSDVEQAWRAAGERDMAYGVREGQYTPPQPAGPVSPQAADLAQAWQGVQPYTVPVAPEGAANTPQQPGQPTTITAGYQVEGQDPSGPSILPNRITKADLRRETGGPAEGDYVQVEGRRGVLVARQGRSGTVRTEDGQTITDVKLEGLAWMRRPERPATSQEIERPMPVPDLEQPAAAQPQQTTQVPGIDTVAGWQGQQPFARPAAQPQQQSNPVAGWETVTPPVIVTGAELELAQQIRDNQDAAKLEEALSKTSSGVVRLKAGGTVKFGGGLGKAKAKSAMILPEDEGGPRRVLLKADKGAVEIPLSDIAKIEASAGKGKSKTLWEARGETQAQVSQPDQAAAAATQQEASPVDPPKKAAFGKRDGVVERRDLGVKDGAGLGVTEAENAGLGAAVSAADTKRTQRIQKALEKFIPGVQVEIAEDNSGFEITLPRNGRRVRFVRVEQITPRPGQKAYGAFTLISDTMLADGSSDVSRFGDGLVAISEHFDADLKYSRKSPFGRVDSDRTRLETTVLHEMLHAALAFGLIDKNSKEWQELARTYGRTKNADGSPVTAAQIEEDVVTSIEDWYANSGLFDRVVQFFVAIADALKVGGFLPKSVAITQARIVGGQVFSRPSNTAQSKSQWAASLMSTVQFSVADAAEAGADPVELEQAAEAWRTLKTQSPWFRSWFGNSVVADEYGNPREVFHGTASNFLEVDRNKGEFGFHVGTLEQAEERAYAKSTTSYDFVSQRVTRPGANVMPLYVRLENPVRLQDRGNWNGGDILKQLIDRGIVTMDEAVATAPPKEVAPDDMADYRKARVIELLQSKGYDGVVYLNRYENTINGPDTILDAYQLSDEKFAEKYPAAADSYIVFDPEQVKSSIGNRGTFDPNSPSMVFSEVSQVPPELRTTVSTRKPSAKGKEDLSYREELIVNSEELFGSPKRQATLQSQMGNFIALAETDDDGNPKSTNELLRELYNSIVENLLWLHDHMQPAVRARAQLWYDGAKRITEGWAKKFSLDQRQVAGIIAVLSPQMDWFRNVSLAERAMRILRDHGDEAWSDGMTQWFESWVNAAETVTEKNKRRAHLATAMRIRDSGLTLNQLPIEDTGHFIRAFDEAYFSRKYRLVTPEGGFGAWAEKENALGEEDFEVTEDGDKITPGAVTWSGFATIAKTSAIFRAVPGVDLMRVLDDRLGAEHKVRNFYNNIIDPNSKAGHVTIDSHAAAAAYIRATSGADITTSMSLGAKGGSSAAEGSSGLYGLVADAYREAAAKRGILAREMQSITWEAVRSLFPAKAKRVGTYKADIDKVWERVRRGELSATDAREEISKYAGGIKPISWEGTPEGVGVEDGGASFDGVLSPDPDQRPVRLLGEEVAMDSIRVSLSAATTAIPGIKALHDRARAGDMMAHQLLQDVAFDNLKNLMAGVPNVSIRKVPVTGLYGGDIEPSLALTIRFGEESRDLVMPRLKKFADNFNQQQVHVRKSAGKKDFGKPRAADGSFVTQVVRIAHEGSLTTAQVQAIINEVNEYAVKRPRGPFKPGPRKLSKKQLADHHPFALEGLTVGDGFIEAYYAGNPEDQRAVDKWHASVERVIELLGAGKREISQTYARLWAYGDREYGGIGWDGLPSYVPAPGEASKDLISQKTTERIAKYLLRVGDTPGKVTPFHQAPKITKEQARLQRRIMEIYESLPDNDLKRAIVKKAYKEAAAAILEQYLALPIQVEVQLKRDADKNPIRDEQGNLIAAAFDEGEPYENSAEMRRDVAVNNHMFVFGTTPNSFGPEGVDFSFHPLLQKPMVRNAEGKLEQLKDINGYPLLYNDLLRAVHDYFAHTLSPVQFGAKGEEAAWANHMAVTMNPWARWAITTETRGQNSWVNFRPGVEKLTALERGFARQKAVLLPIEYTYTGVAKIDKVMKEFEKSLTQAERMGSAKSKTLAGTIAKADAVAMLYSNESAESLDHLYKRPKQNKVSNLFRWLFTSRGELPQSAYTLKEHMHGYIASHEKRMEFVMRDLKKAVKQVYGEVPQLNSRDWQIISNVLRGGDPNMLPLPMRDPVVRMRQHVDELSRAIIESGAASEGLAATIDQNLGVYLTRTYRVFSDSNWKYKVPAEVKARFIRFLEQQYPDASENQLQQMMKELLNKDSGAPAKALSGKLGAKLLDVLKAKKNLPEELRELWGEETNPLINYAASISKMTKLVAGHQFLTEAREAGLGKWLFEKDDPNIDPEASTKIAAEGSHPMAPLNGLRTYPEIIEAFENEYKMPPIAYGWRWYFTLNSVAKAAKTVGSSVTQIRNFWSNVGMVAANGNWQVGNLRKALKAARPQLEAILGRSGASDADMWRDFHTRLTELGVVGEEVGIGELKQLLSDAALEGESKWLNNAMVRTGKAVAEGAAELYQWSDNFWKAYAWLNERAKYQKAFPEASSEWLDRTAANIVRDTMPTYGRIPKGIQYLRRIPLGNFFAWPAEIVRTVLKAWQLAFNELQNPETRAIGAQRMVGLFGAIAAPAATKMALQLLLGFTDEDDEDRREFVPPWSKNSLIAWFDDGTYLDMSYLDPYSYLRKPVLAVLYGEDVVDGAVQAATELASPFFSEQLLGERIADVTIRQGVTKDGRMVYNPQDEFSDKASAVLLHVLEPTVPAVLVGLRNIWLGATGKTGDQGKVYDPMIELTSMVSGARISKIDIEQSLSFQIGDYDKAIEQANSIAGRTAVNRGSISSEELSDAYRRTDNARRRNFSVMHDKVHAALRQGVPEEHVRQLMKDRKMSDVDIEALISGEYKPYMPGAASLEVIASRPDGARRVADLQTLWIANSPNPQDAQGELNEAEMRRLKNAYATLRSAGNPEAARKRAAFKRGETPEARAARMAEFARGVTEAQQEVQRLEPKYREVFGGKR